MITVRVNIDTEGFASEIEEVVKRGAAIGALHVAESIKEDLITNANAGSTKDKSDGRMPVYTGEMRDSITIEQVGETNYSVTINAPYAYDIEYGELERTEYKTGKFDKWIKDKIPRSTWSRRKEGAEITWDMEPHPFFRFAVERAEEYAPTLIEDAIQTELRRV